VAVDYLFFLFLVIINLLCTAINPRFLVIMCHLFLLSDSTKSLYRTDFYLYVFSLHSFHFFNCFFFHSSSFFTVTINLNRPHHSRFEKDDTIIEGGEADEADKDDNDDDEDDND